MGCLCCKPSAIEDSKESPRERLSSKASSDLRVSRATSSRREEAYRAKDRCDGNDGRTMLIDKQVNGSLRVHGGEHVERKREKSEYAVVHHPGMGSIPKATEGEQVAAGWPSWLATVAGEAIKGWLPRRADSFEKLDKIGQGTYSNVYRARDLDQKKIVALKKVRFDNLEPESVRFMAREIHILRRLNHPNVIKLEGLVTSRMSCSLYLVFEYMEHDLAGLAAHPGLKFTEAQVKCYMQQLLRGLDHCHSRGVLHRDIKGSNLLIDNNGILKIADFGLASFYDPAHVQPLTSRVVTLWYRPPELLLGATYYGTAVDLWSTGCILAELYAGKPIMPGRTEVEQLHKIFKLCGSPSEDYWRKSKLPHATIFKPQQPYRRCVADTFKEFPPPALALMETLLSIDPADRGSAASALRSEFFITKPLPCDPSSFPKYPPSKEFDAKMRDEEARRQGAAGSKGQKSDMERRGRRESRAVPAPDANAELVLSIQKRHGQSNSKSRSEKFNPHPEEVASGFPIDPPRPSQAAESNMDPQGHHHKRASHSGPLSHRAAWAKASRNPDDAPKISTGADLSTISSLVAARRSLLSEDRNERSGLAQPEVPKLMARFPGSFKETSESFTQQDPKHPSQGVAGFYQKDDGRNSSKDPVLLGYGSKGHKIHYSGPLIVPSGNVDQMLKDHDRQIQEAVRRARLDKEKICHFLALKSYNLVLLPSLETLHVSLVESSTTPKFPTRYPNSSKLLPFSSSFTFLITSFSSLPAHGLVSYLMPFIGIEGIIIKPGLADASFEKASCFLDLNNTMFLLIFRRYFLMKCKKIKPSTSSFPSLSTLMLSLNSFANFNYRDHRETQTHVLKVGLAGSERSILGATTGGCSFS
nr:putative serine/threonine-protein kinase [Populus alba]